MLQQGNYRIILFLLFNAVLSGLVFAGIYSGFSFMLAEKGENSFVISAILSATIPYSFKFIISPFIRNWFTRFSKDKFCYVKMTIIALQVFIFFLFSLLGFFHRGQVFWIVWAEIFLLTAAIIPIDIICVHIKLVSLEKRELGIVTAIESTGFRVSTFVFPTLILYLADTMGWEKSFLVIGIVPTMLSILATIFVSKIEYAAKASKSFSIKELALFYWKFLKRHRALLVIILMISFKLTDSSVNSLKTIFFNSFYHIGKIEFAKIAYTFGFFSTLIGGVVAGWLLSKVDIKKCITISLILLYVILTLFLMASNFKTLIESMLNPLLPLALLINIATCSFSFSGIILRTYLAEESHKDANIYLLLLSIGSLLRNILCFIAGMIVNNYSWNIMFILCFVSVIPGLYVCNRLHNKN
ncbi:MAG: MFS transporter [Holosporales bacterium]|nr:MFS transporter [Holosporales bacterium]